jgi:hypothetical protein
VPASAPDSAVGHQVIVGEPEYGYALRNVYPGAGAATVVGSGVVLRAGAAIYAGVSVGADTTIGHHTLLRTNVRVGSGSQLAANLTVERGSTIGDGVRCSPGSHITADTVIEDGAFLGAGVRTVNDKELIWRDPEHEQPLSPPRLGHSCKIGSGAVILAAVEQTHQMWSPIRLARGTRRAIRSPVKFSAGATAPSGSLMEYQHGDIQTTFPTPNRVHARVDGPRLGDPGPRCWQRPSAMARREST